MGRKAVDKCVQASVLHAECANGLTLMELNSIKIWPHIHRHKGGIMQPAEDVCELNIPTKIDGTDPAYLQKKNNRKLNPRYNCVVL